MRKHMPDSHTRRAAEVNPTDIKVRFSPAIKGILTDLDTAVASSRHFDGDIRHILHQWTTAVTPTLNGVLSALPVVADETLKHIQATADKNAAHAWKEFVYQMGEKQAFTLVRRERNR